MNVLREKLKLLPDSPGVYLMRDSEGTIIYVGKARVLKNRVRQYFHDSEKSGKVQAMVDNIADFSYVVTPSEADALALENTYIKKYKPKYNILLKDDKTYPYLKVTKEEFPRVCITRRVKKDGRYFGPFMGVDVKQIVDIAEKLYHIRGCSTAVTGKAKKPCLNYHLGRCQAPCAGLITKEEYAACVEKTIGFLSGNLEEAESLLQEKMQECAGREEFELAMQYRDQAAMIAKLKQKRITSMPKNVDADIWAYRSNGLYAAISLLITRKGVMSGSKNFAVEEGADDDGERFLSFVSQYYTSHEIPHEIVTDEQFDEDLLLEFSLKKGAKCEVINPKSGVREKLLQMAKSNAEEYLNKSISAIEHKTDMTKNACERLKTVLSLKRYPKRMECYDISNISGVDKVASMAVFTDGEADKFAYRRFKIKTVEGADDFASLKETLTRRLKKLGTEEEERFPKPQLVVIDGGKGQLSSVKEVFDELGIYDIDLISLAKQEEIIYTLNGDEGVKLARNDYALQMLQRIRDEAHRFAITYFRSLHGKRNLASVLEEIGGIGKQKRIALMQKFGTMENIASADVEELATVEGIGPKLAQNIKDYFDRI